MEQPVNFIRTQAEPLTVKYTIRVDRDIEDPSLFQEELATIRQSKEGDIVHLLINSGGGRLDTAKAFLNSMAQSQAHIITEIEGEACSAATLIFLAGDEYRVTDDATMMIHTSTYGYVAKENNVRQYVEHQAKATDRLIKKYYRHFMSEDEISEVLNGKDLWMDADEIMERLEKRMELFEAEESEFMKQFEEGEEPLYSKEYFEDKSKEEILAMLFGEDEAPNVETVKAMNSNENLEYETIEDLMEDCGVEYEGDNFKCKHFEQGIYELKVYSNGKLDCCDDEPLFTSFLETQDEFGVEDLKMYADLLGVKFPHNIGQDTLAQKLDSKVKEIVDSLNKD